MFLMFFFGLCYKNDFYFFCVVLSSHKHTFKKYVFYYAICLSTPHVYCDMANVLGYLHLLRNIGFFFNMVAS